jgi:hypothetical protein
MLTTFEIISKKCFMRSVEPKLLPTATFDDKMWVIRIVGRKLLPTAAVGDKKCLIGSVGSILPRPTRHDQIGGVS